MFEATKEIGVCQFSLRLGFTGINVISIGLIEWKVPTFGHLLPHGPVIPGVEWGMVAWH